MPSQEDIDAQLRLLAVHRRTLAHLLEQHATHTAPYVPPAIVSSIGEARESIQQIKYTLRAWNIPIDDLPDDGDMVNDQLTGTVVGRLRVIPIRSGATWRLVVENTSDQEILSIALTIRPPPSLFIGQMQFAIPRILAHGRVETKPFTIVDPKAKPRVMVNTSSLSILQARRVRLEQQHDRLDRLIAESNEDIDRLEHQRRRATGREQLQREAEIQQLQKDRERYEEELQTIEAQLERIPAGIELDHPQSGTTESVHYTTSVQLRLLVAYIVVSQGIERAEDDLLISLA